MSEKHDTLTLKHRIGYALGDFGGCMTFGLMTAFLTRYYVNIALIDTAIIAMMTLIWKIFDAVSNPIVGVLLDKAFANSDGKKENSVRGFLRFHRCFLSAQFWSLLLQAG